MTARFKKNIQKVINKVGLDNINKPVDFTGIESFSPLSALYLSHKSDFVIKVPLAKCLHFGLSSYSCLQESASPFIMTLNSYKNGECHTYKGSYLEKFYSNIQPTSAAEMLQIENPKYTDFLSLPAAAALTPWMKISPSDLLDAMKHLEYIESRENGYKLDIKDGCRYYGPVTQLKGELEFERLIRVYESIKNNGFINSRNGVDNIKANILYSKCDEWKAYIVSGQHRIAALTVLGYEYVVVQIPFHGEGIKGIVMERDVEHWPGVTNSYYSVQESTEIFNRVFSGDGISY